MQSQRNHTLIQPHTSAKNKIAADKLISFFNDLNEWSEKVFRDHNNFLKAYAFAVSYRKPATNKQLFVDTLRSRLNESYAQENPQIKNRLEALLWDINELFTSKIFSPILAKKAGAFFKDELSAKTELFNELLLPLNHSELVARYENMEKILNKIKPHHESIRNVLRQIESENATLAIENAHRVLATKQPNSNDDAHDELISRIIARPPVSQRAPKTIQKPSPHTTTAATTNIKKEAPIVSKIPRIARSAKPIISVAISSTQIEEPLNETSISLPGQLNQSTESEVTKILNRKARKLSTSLFDDLSDSSDDEKIITQNINIIKTLPTEITAIPKQPEPTEAKIPVDLNSLKLQELSKVLDDIQFWNHNTSYKFLRGGVCTKIGGLELRVPKHIVEFRNLIMNNSADAAIQLITNKADTQVIDKNSGFRMCGLFKVRNEPMDNLLKIVATSLSDNNCNAATFKQLLETIKPGHTWQTPVSTIAPTIKI